MSGSEIALPPAVLGPEELAGWSHDRNGGCIFLAARRRGLQAEVVDHSPRRRAPLEPWVRLTLPKRGYLCRKGRILVERKSLLGTRWRRLNGNSARITHGKSATKRHLADRGFSVPEGAVFTPGQFEDARTFFRRLDGPVCVKPTYGGAGVAVSTAIADGDSFAAAFRLAAAEPGQSVVVERHVVGVPLRFLCLDGKVLAQRADTPANVCGDGVRSISELVEEKNRQRLRYPGLAPIPLGPEAIRLLGAQGLALNTIPPLGKTVSLGGISNVTAGGDSDTSVAVHPSYGDVSLAAVGSIRGLRLSTIDLIVESLEQPASATNHHILEINSAPGLVTFHFPWRGPPIDAAGRVVEWLRDN